MQTLLKPSLRVLLLACLPALAVAQTNPTPPDTYEALAAAWETSMNEFRADYSKATTDDERRILLDTKLPKVEPYAARMRALAKASSKAPWAVDCLVWALEHSPEPDGALLEELRGHLDNERILPVCRKLPDLRVPSTREFLQAALEQSPHEAVRGTACYAIAKLLQMRAREARALRLSEAKGRAKQLVQALGEKAAAELRATDPDTLEHQAIEYLDRVIASYAKVPGVRRPLGESAKGELYSLRNLAVGQVAPDIEGQDVDGVSFQLSDYRGKVIFLDFWGFW